MSYSHHFQSATAVHLRDNQLESAKEFSTKTASTVNYHLAGPKTAGKWFTEVRNGRG